MSEPKAPWVETVSGRRVSLVEPDPESISIEDIAHHLSKLCRFAGASRTFYSVAEHAVRVSKAFDVAPDCVLSKPRKIWGLLHDAHEAYLGDIIRPVKQLPGVREAIEGAAKALDDAIWQRLVLPLLWSDGMWVDEYHAKHRRESVAAAVGQYDGDLLYDEKCGLLSPEPWVQFGCNVRKPVNPIHVNTTLSPASAEAQFLTRWTELVYGG